MKRIIFPLTIIFLTSCAVSKYSTTWVSCDYDQKKDQTIYIVMPYGSVSIHGKWEQKTYTKSSRQQFLINSDSITISIAVTLWNKYEFNTDGAKKGFEFVKAFYEWDSEFFVNKVGFQVEQIESNSIDNFIIWRFWGDHNNSKYDTYLLFSERKGIVKNYAVMITDKWTTEQKVDFLRNLCLQN